MALSASPPLSGIHHLTAVCANAKRTVGFYTGLLGFRLVKKTVNYDNPGSYHLYFGDADGSPGTLITFFEWRKVAKGAWGIGTTHHLAFCVETAEAQLMWKRWLIDQGVGVSGPYDRTYFRSIYFADPDGLILEIATRLPGWTVDESADALGTHELAPPVGLTKFGRNEEEIARTTWPEAVPRIAPAMRLSGLHHITAIASDIGRTAAFYTELLGMRLLKKTLNFDDPTSPHYYFGAGEGAPGSIITYFGYPREKMRAGRIGVGVTHHFAFVVADEESQLMWRVRLMESGVRVSAVMNRLYFRSIYFADPDGHVLEIATKGPGFAVDEPAGELGRSLRLPPWLEAQRNTIEEALEAL
jgi:glyoxalase family protein